LNQTSNTAIVLRYANYRENDRMLTLFSPTRGLVEAVARGCRRPKSKLLSASELFALGDNEEAAVLIPIGYPADSAKEKSRKPLDEIFQK
jgi:hypothetical protein